MGWHWYLYNETLDQYYSTGSSCLDDIQHHLIYVFEQVQWSLDHSLHYRSDETHIIDESRVIN